MRSAPLRRLTGVMEHLVDPRVGILHSVEEMRVEAGSPAFFHAVARLGSTRAFSPFAAQAYMGGAARDRAAAAAEAVTGALAVYCAALRPLEEDMRPVAAAGAAPFRCVPPGDFALFSAAQYAREGFPWEPFTDTTPVRWAPAVDPLRGETWFVPSALVYLPYDPLRTPGEAAIAPATSTGLACHWSPAEAALAALCDAVECDALSIVWQARLAMPHVRVETLSDANYDLVELFERTGAEVTLLDLRLDLGLPTFLAALANRSPTAPALVFAAGTDPDPEIALCRCLERLAHAQPYCQMIHSQRPRRDGEDDAGSDSGNDSGNGIEDQESHLGFWCDHAHAPLAGFLFRSPERREHEEIGSLCGGDAERDVTDLLGRLAALGLRGLLADLTSPDVREAGLTVTRAVVPGLQPLFYGQGRRGLGGARLREVPARLGLAALDPVRSTLPHPFSRKGVER